MSVIGVLLAAGRGRRLGGNKQLSPWPSVHGAGTLISSAFDHISVACDEIIVVLGHRQAEIEEALRPRVHATIHTDADADMSRSIQVGIEFALRVEDVDCILLQLGDHPQVAPATLEAIIQSAQSLDRAVAPQYQGQHGHPIAIPTRLAREIIETGLPGGLAEWFREDESRRQFIEVDDPSVVMDIDTPQDLAQASSSVS
ncbi:MAG: nucleotidyltransferase family protein [Planctomycetota bacterium]|nr:nucleotidyltransferase family protein [Planctomycetota bacterium]